MRRTYQEEFTLETQQNNTDENCLLPPGMTAEEFATRKRKLKRRWIANYIFWMFVIVAVFEYLWWLSGVYVEAYPRHLEELQTMSGTFVVTNGSARIKIISTGVKDEETGNIVWFDSVLCGIDKGKEWRKYEGHPAKIWYYYGSGQSNFLYQLEVNGKLISDLATANSRVGEINERKKTSKPWTRFGISLSFAVLIGIAHYGLYLQAKEKLCKGDG